MSEVLSVFLFQLFLCIAIFSTAEVPTFEEPPTLAMAYTRLLAGMFLQIQMSSELKEGMQKMKYALNHPWKMNQPQMAFFCGLFQATIIILVTLLNYFTIVSAESVIDVVMNFLALEVIAQLDDYFFVAHGNSELGKVMVLNADEQYSDLYKIEVTTSTDAA